MEQDAGQVGLGGALRRAWIGYRRLLDAEIEAAGFGNRRFPDGRALRICSASADVTISRLGRDLGITRQGASKLVATLVERSYVVLSDSRTDGREKIVTLTRRGNELLAAQRVAARTIERRLRSEIGSEAFDGLYGLLEALGGDSQPRMSEVLGTVRDP